MNNQAIPIGKLFDIEKGGLQSTKCTPGDYDFITAAEDWKTHNVYSHECEALIFAAAASGSLGRTHYVDGKFTTSDLCYILTPKDEAKYPLNLSFYHFVFNSLRPTLVAATKSGTSKESINQTNFKKYEIPYFDVELQDFWIEKLKNTLGLKDLLGGELTHQQTLLKKLRQQILQEAIEGKLTADWRAQNPDVEPASELLKRIAAEKAQLVKDKKIKAQKPLPPIADEEKPFELPGGWEWCRLGNLLETIQYGTSKKCTSEQSKETPILRIPNVSSGTVCTSELKYTVLSEKEKLQYSLKEGDLLIIRSNGSRELVGRTAYINDSFENYGFAGYLIRLRFLPEMAGSRLIQLFLSSPFIRASIENPLRTTVGINNINSTEISNLSVCIPPLEEQEEIFRKVEMSHLICDQLETQITQNQSHAEQLMQAVLKEAFNHNSSSLPAASNSQEATFV